MTRERGQRSKVVPKLSDNLPQGHSITLQTYELFCSEQVMRNVNLITKPGSNVAINYADKHASRMDESLLDGSQLGAEITST